MTSNSYSLRWMLPFLLLLHWLKEAHSSNPHRSFLQTLLRGGDEKESSNEDFQILEEKLVYSGWRTITQRKVRMRNGKVVDFDVSCSWMVDLAWVQKLLNMSRSKSLMILVGGRKDRWRGSVGVCLEY